MKKIFCSLGLMAMICMSGIAQAETAIWDVATVHGKNEFTISPDGSSLFYNQQGWTDYVWYNNDGTIAQGAYGDRTGMRTFATTNVALGQRIDALKLQFEYNNNSTLGGYPTINFFFTDGSGNYGILSPASGGILALSTSVINDDWTTMTFDLTSTSIPNNTLVAVFEHNDLAGYPASSGKTMMTWGDIKGFTIAGMYDYQRSPTNGWGAWSTMFDPINSAGSATVVNGYGLALIHGDTANSNNYYGTKQRQIRNVTVSFDSKDYDGTFVNAQAPPVIDAHDNVTAVATSADGATVTYTPPATHDAVDGDGIATCSPASGRTFPIGSTPVICTAADTAGNQAALTSFTVTVVRPVATNKNQCKNGGWGYLARVNGTVFKNHGDCVSYTNNGK